MAKNCCPLNSSSAGRLRQEPSITKNCWSSSSSSAGNCCTSSSKCGCSKWKSRAQVAESFLKVRRADCVTNAPVPQGTTALSTPPFVRAGYDCQKQHHRPETPRSRGVGTPRVMPAPLTTSLRGLWVSVASCHRAMVERTKGRRPKNRPCDTKGRRPKNRPAKGGTLEATWVRGERDPRTLASWRHWFSASCRGNCLRYADKFQADTLRNGMSLVGFRNWTIGQWYGLISSCLYCMWLRGYGYSFSWCSSTGSSCYYANAPGLFGGRGEMAMAVPCCHPLYGTACAVGLT